MINLVTLLGTEFADRDHDAIVIYGSPEWSPPLKQVTIALREYGAYGSTPARMVGILYLSDDGLGRKAGDFAPHGTATFGDVTKVRAAIRRAIEDIPRVDPRVDS